MGPDGAAWVTDGGLNAIVRVDPDTDAVDVYPLPADRPNVNLNTAVFGGDGRLWFTGQNGIIGRLDPATGAMDVFDAPRGTGPYGIAATPAGEVYFASLAGSYVGRIDLDSGAVTELEPPTPGQGAVASGRTRTVASGSASGRPAGSPSTTPPTAPGASGSCRGRSCRAISLPPHRRPTPSSTTMRTTFG